MLSNQEIEHRFTYHPPTTEQQACYVAIRDTAKMLADILNQVCPDSREKSVAFTKLDEVVMWGNAAVARGLD